MGRGIRHSRCEARGRAAVVWCYLYGQHANGVSVAAIRLFAVLSQERCAAADYDGDDLPCFGQFHGVAMDRSRPLHYLPANYPLAPEHSLFGSLIGGPQSMSF